MKLASYQDGSRDGQLLIVSRDLTTAHYATGIASRLQQVLDDWNFLSPQLQDLYETLNGGKARHAFPFDPAQCLAPLPRAYQRIQGAAYAGAAHAGTGDAAGAPGAGAGLDAAPALIQAASDGLLGPQHTVRLPCEGHPIDVAAQLAVITGDVPVQASAEQGLDSIRLLLLVGAVHLSAAPGAGETTGCGSFHAQPATSFGPVAVTPDELGDAWAEGRAHLAVQLDCNGRKVGRCDAGAAMRFHFGQLIAEAARTRGLGAGSIVASGAVTDPAIAADGQRTWPHGHASLADRRAMERTQSGAPQTEYLRAGDAVRIEVKGRDGSSVFGAIELNLREI